jgi:hypothetical protein
LLYSAAGFRLCKRPLKGTVSLDLMNSSRSSGRIRIEVTIQTYGRSLARSGEASVSLGTTA